MALTEIPSGIDHLKMVVACSQISTNEHKAKIDFSDSRFGLLGISLSTLYEAATCHRGCKGVGHIFERLSAKAYNLACSAYILTLNGFYDEALIIIRSVGELTNLISLSFVDSESFQNWLNADSNSRKKNFGPYKVRMLLEPHKDVGFLIADQHWYGALSEDYCHIKPDVKPNNHNDSRSIAGGLYQKDGVEKALDTLCNVVIPTAIMISKRMDFDDKFEELSTLFKTL